MGGGGGGGGRSAIIMLLSMHELVLQTHYSCIHVLSFIKDRKHSNTFISIARKKKSPHTSLETWKAKKELGC